MSYAPATYRPALGATLVTTQAPAPGRIQPPIFPLIVGTNGSFRALRASPAQGSCGTKPYPCMHPGTDVNGVQGTRVNAPESGVVVAASNGSQAPFGGYGPWLIVIKGDSGKFHLLGHLDPSTASHAPVGARVTAGQQVGTTSSANHTHWEVRRKLTPDYAKGEDNFTNNVDPVLWLGGGSVLLLAAAGLVAFLLLRRR